MIINNETNIGSLIFSISLIQLVSGSVDGFLSLINDIPIYKINNNIYNDILHVSNINQNDISIKIKSKITKIQYENVNFKNIIRDFSSIINNDTLLFGKSGIGKSTLVKMLTKKYDADGGDIFLNEINLKNIDND
jgi:ABC-type bacteriocin/lantibiotic exporter with double-glycine peptidase domain